MYSSPCCLHSFPTRRSSDLDRRRPDHDAMVATWWRYLRIAWVREPVGQHYLRRMLVSFKFELNMFAASRAIDRKSTRLNSSHTVISYAVFCLKKKKSN